MARILIRNKSVPKRALFAQSTGGTVSIGTDSPEVMNRTSVEQLGETCDAMTPVYFSDDGKIYKSSCLGFPADAVTMDAGLIDEFVSVVHFGEIEPVTEVNLCLGIGELIEGSALPVNANFLQKIITVNNYRNYVELSRVLYIE